MGDFGFEQGGVAAAGGDAMSPTAYQTDHLFLLMGGNPLPNAVAALTLLKPGGTPHIVHTRQTQTQAQNLMALLQEGFGYQSSPLIDLDSAQAEALIIRDRVRRRASVLMGRVGLNYTGGTKPMSVNAYRAVAEVCPDAIFSYLDSSTSAMIVESDGTPSPRLPLAINLSLEQLFQLHGLRWRANQPPLTEPILPEAAAHLAQVYQSWGLVRNWRQWCQNSLLPLTKDRDYWLPEWQLAEAQPVSLTGLATPLKDVLQTHLGASQGELSLAKACQRGFGSLTQVCSWLDGLWLEHYTLTQVQGMAPGFAIQEAGLGFHIVEPANPTPRYDKFEFDVAFMQSYHLFALSCTTATGRGRCKQKLLEAVVRARQLGGSEARVALVCGYHRAEELQAELEVMGRDRRVAVFGRYDWPRLGRKIAEWVERNG
ncbi:MAG: DUF1887 family protein [Nodosilinea sp. WJT8-NPBG4]|jgi:hypothetical protein|nr:DUF1887 family protein [Nodosilinea sp. WJT8-NPBG4]